MKNIFLFIAIGAVISISLLLIFNPTCADIISEEDGFLENGTVLLVGIALILCLPLLYNAIKTKSSIGFWAFMTLMLIIFLGDEISWGFRYFGITKPRIAGAGFDGLHDILAIGIGTLKMIRGYIRRAGFFSITSIAIYIGATASVTGIFYYIIKYIVIYKDKIKEFFSKNLKWRPFLFLFIGILLLIVAMIIDEDNLVNFPHKSIVEETMELLAAAAFLFSCLSGFIKRERRCTT